MAQGNAAVTETEWKGFVRAFKAEMDVPTARRTLDLLAALPRGTNLSIGCYCENEPAATGLCFASYWRTAARASGSRGRNSRGSGR